MLSFWHASFLVIMSLMWKVQPTYADIDVCDLRSSSSISTFYCSCDPIGQIHTSITCFLFGTLDNSSEVWDSFKGHDDAVALTLTSRLPYQLNFIPTRTLKSLPSLETLEIRAGNLGSLASGAISNLTKLKNLRLQRNEITALERHSIANLPKLKTLTLSENFFTEILAESFYGLDELELLTLDASNISRIEACSFCNLHSLKELELWRNSITDLTEHTFRGLRYVHNLDLFDNKISVINENVFQAMPKLRELNLKNNLIHYISPRAFEGLNQLASLHLSNNKLKSLPVNLFDNLPKLVLVDISFNELETLTAENMKGFRNAFSEFFTLSFRGNPFKCGCNFSWVPNYAKKSPSTMFLKELTHVTCNSTEGQKKELSSLHFKNCKAKKPMKSAPQPTLSTLNSFSKQPVLANPTYVSEPAQKKGNASDYRVPSAVPPVQSAPGAGNSVTLNVALFVYTSFVVAIVWTL